MQCPKHTPSDTSGINPRLLFSASSSKLCFEHPPRYLDSEPSAKPTAETSISTSLQPPPARLLAGHSTFHRIQGNPDSDQPHTARGHPLEMLTETHPNGTLTYTSLKCSFCNCQQYLQVLASPLFELGPDPEGPYAYVYFSNKLLHMQGSAEPVVWYHRASFQCC